MSVVGTEAGCFTALSPFPRIVGTENGQCRSALQADERSAEKRMNRRRPMWSGSGPPASQAYAAEPDPAFGSSGDNTKCGSAERSVANSMVFSQAMPSSYCLLVRFQRCAAPIQPRCRGHHRCWRNGPMTSGRVRRSRPRRRPSPTRQLRSVEGRGLRHAVHLAPMRRSASRVPAKFPPFDPVFPPFEPDRPRSRPHGKNGRSCSPS